MTRLTTPLPQPSLLARFVLELATSIALIAHLSAPAALAGITYSYGMSWMNDGYSPTGDAAVVAALAANIDEVGNADGLAIFQFLDVNTHDRLEIKAELLRASLTFDDRGAVVLTEFAGIAKVTAAGETSERNVVINMSLGGATRVQLSGDSVDATFSAGVPAGHFGVETVGGLDRAVAVAAVRLGDSGELDTMALGVVGLTTGEVLGATDFQMESGREPLIATGDVTKLRIQQGRQDVSIDLRGTSTVLSPDGECVSMSSADFLMPIEDVFSISGQGTFQAPRCGARMTMSSADPRIAWISGIVFR